MNPFKGGLSLCVHLLLGATSLQAQTVYEVIAADTSLTTLTRALDTIGYDDILSDATNEFTVFAPTNHAFAAIDPDTLNALLGDPERLAAILDYHVVAGRFSTDQIIEEGKLVALSLDTLRFTMIGGSEPDLIAVGNAGFVDRDISADNGTVHTINGIVTPFDSGPLSVKPLGRGYKHSHLPQSDR